MKKILLVAALLALAACAVFDKAVTPQDKYLVLVKSVTATGQTAQAYVDNCKKQEKADPCYSNLPKIHAATLMMIDALDQANKVFVTGDSAYYDLSQTVVENAVKDLTKLITPGQ